MTSSCRSQWLLHIRLLCFLSDAVLTWSTTLSQCLDVVQSPNGCSLPAGRYEVEDMPIILNNHNLFTITAAGDGEVVIDGSKELSLTWKECLVSDHADCGAGVYVADLGGQKPFQLFMGGVDVHTRNLLLPARWPNVPQKPEHFPHDSPTWAHAFDSRRAWSIVKTDSDDCAGPEPDASCESQRTDPAQGNAMNTGIIVDDGAGSRIVHIETEDGDTFDLTITGQGALSAETFSAQGATFLISFGKRMVEIGEVVTHTAGSDTFTYRMPECSTELYCSCGKKAKFMDIKYYFENAVALIDQPYEFAVKNDKLYMKLNPTTDLNSAGGNTYTLKQDKKVWARLETSVAAVAAGASEGDAFYAGGAFDIQSHTMTISDITFFATSPVMTVSKKKTKMIGNTILYPFATRRLAGIYEYPTMPHLKVQGNDCEVKNNIIKYSEGMAIEGGGNNFQLLNNLFEWNGYLSPDGPQTVLFSNGVVTRNELYWNGQVSGFKLTGDQCPYNLNNVEYQGFGQLLHDGAGFHVQTAAQNGTFTQNWVSECHQSLGIRFDTASTTQMHEIGRHGQLRNNVLWKAPMVLKGDEHTVESNTIINTRCQLVRAFGEQQGMNEATNVLTNLLSDAPVPRGKQWSGVGNTPLGYDRVVQAGPSESASALNWMSLSQKWGWQAKSDFTTDATLTFDAQIDKDAILREVKNGGGTVVKDWDQLMLHTDKTGANSLFQVAAIAGYTWRWRTERRPVGPEWTLGGTVTGNDVGNADTKVRNYALRDFRPIASVTAGAYTAQTGAANEAYWIPGFKDKKARKASPLPGSADVPTTASLMFLQARDCTEHTIELSENNGAAQSHTLTGDTNVWNTPGLQASASYRWRVISAASCGTEASEWWEFTTVGYTGGGNTATNTAASGGNAATSAGNTATSGGNTDTSTGNTATSGGSGNTATSGGVVGDNGNTATSGGSGNTATNGGSGNTATNGGSGNTGGGSGTSRGGSQQTSGGDVNTGGSGSNQRSLDDSSSEDNAAASATNAAASVSWRDIGAGDCRTETGGAPKRFQKDTAMTEDECKASCAGFDWCQAVAHTGAPHYCFAYVGYSADPETPAGWQNSSFGAGTATVFYATDRPDHHCFGKPAELATVKKNSDNTGVIVAIIASSVVGVLLIAAGGAAIAYRISKRKKKASDPDLSMAKPEFDEKTVLTSAKATASGSLGVAPLAAADNVKINIDEPGKQKSTLHDSVETVDSVDSGGKTAPVEKASEKLRKPKSPRRLKTDEPTRKNSLHSSNSTEGGEPKLETSAASMKSPRGGNSNVKRQKSPPNAKRDRGHKDKSPSRAMTTEVSHKTKDNSDISKSRSEKPRRKDEEHSSKHRTPRGETRGV